MWLRNYDILKLSACMPMNKLDGAGLGESQRLWYKGVDGIKNGWMLTLTRIQIHTHPY